LTSAYDTNLSNITSTVSSSSVKEKAILRNNWRHDYCYVVVQIDPQPTIWNSNRILFFLPKVEVENRAPQFEKNGDASPPAAEEN
jgi:hypothetical protein